MIQKRCADPFWEIKMICEDLKSHTLIPSLWDRVAMSQSFTILIDPSPEDPPDCDWNFTVKLSMRYLGADAGGTSRWDYIFQKFDENGFDHNYVGTLTLDHTRRCVLHQTLIDSVGNNYIRNFSTMMGMVFADVNPSDPCPELHSKGNKQYETDLSFKFPFWSVP
jgi:hypothetical protein